MSQPLKSLTDIQRRNPDEVLKGLLSDNETESRAAGTKLVRQAASFGLNVRDYLTLACKGEDKLSGYEVSLHQLNLPVKNDFNEGITLQAASNTFQTYPGTRAMFPEVIDDMLRWVTRQDQFEVVGPMLANSRTIDGVEMIRTVVDDHDAEDTYRTQAVPELGRIPVRTLRTSETSVKIWKHGSALRTSYEFSRRASLDLLTPHARRIARQLELSKVAAATDVLVNGDNVHGAATVTAQSGYDTVTGATAVANKLSWEHFLYWLVQRAKNGTPVDTVIGNWDSAFKWAQMWKIPDNETRSDAENFGAVSTNIGGGTMQIPLPRFVLSSQAPSNRLIGITAGETLEELVEAGSNIEESERSILNQAILYTKTANTGYSLAYGDTREIFNYGA